MSEQLARLEGMLKNLNLKGMLGCYLELAERAAQSKLGYEEYLCLLLEEELKGKTDRSVKSKIHKAWLPFIKSLEEFDYVQCPVM